MDYLEQNVPSCLNTAFLEVSVSNVNYVKTFYVKKIIFVQDNLFEDIDLMIN